MADLPLIAWERAASALAHRPDIDGRSELECVVADELKARILRGMRSRVTNGWAPTCEHGDAGTVPCFVLDPFCGSGRSGRAARRLGRSFVGVELRPEFADLSKREIDSALGERRASPATDPNQKSLFG